MGLPATQARQAIASCGGLVGLWEISSEFSVPLDSPSRAGFPEPVGKADGQRVWLRAEVESWARENMAT